MSRFPSLEVLPSQNLWTLAPCLDFRTSVSPLVAVAPTELSDVWKPRINDGRAVRLRNAHARACPARPERAWPEGWRAGGLGEVPRGCRQVSQQSQKDSAQESICVGITAGLQP